MRGASGAVYFAYSSWRTPKSFRKALNRSSEPFGRRSQSASNFVILGFWVGKSRLLGCSSTPSNVSGSSPTTAVTADITPFIWRELATTFLVAVFVFSAVFFISILENDIELFRWLEMYRLGVPVRGPSCVVSCLVRPQGSGRSPQPTISETADAINQSAKQALGIMNLHQAEYHAIDANHLPLDIVKPGPVLVA